MKYRSFTRDIAEIAVSKFINLYANFDIQRYNISTDDFVIVVADSAVFYIRFDVDCSFVQSEDNRKQYINDGICGVDIEELTPNTVKPDYKHSVFIKAIQQTFEVYTPFIRYGRFKGINQKHLANNMISHADYVIKHCPQIDLQQRLDSWEGTPFTFVIFEMTNIDGKISYAADAIKGHVHPFVLRIANNLARQPYGVCRAVGFGLSEFYQVVDSDFIDSIQSHKGTGRTARLQDNLKYFSFGPIFFKDDRLVRSAVTEYIENARVGKYQSIERIEYSKPEYRWKSEEYILKLVKKHYGKFGVIYQHRPHFLHSSLGSQMSYDIYISGLSLAIEYQGKQHFEPVDYFGGEEAFEKVQIRDMEKRKLSKEHGISLVYINYWEEITPNLIVERINSAIKL